MVVETSPAPALVIAKPNLLLQFVVGYNIPFSGFLVACNAIDSRYLVGAAENSPPSPIRSPGPFDSRPSLDRYPRLLGRQKVRVHGRADERQLANLAKGITVDGIKYGPIKASLDADVKTGKKSANTWLRISLTEGKNREVRKVLAHLGLDVNRLIRTAYGPFQLGKLRRGNIEEVKGKVLREQVGHLDK